MKIKWKITICVLLFITAITIFTNIYYYRTITNLVASETKDELKNYSSLGLTFLDNYYPGEWRLEGNKLYKGYTLMNGNSKVVDFFAKDTGILATVFAKDTRISTTVKDKNGKRAIGTKASDEIISTVLNHHQKYLGTAVVAGNKADTYYVPLYDKSGNIVGMWFVGVYKNVVQSRISRSMSTSNISIAIFLILGLIFSYILGDQISKGIKTIKSNIEQMEKGNFKLNFKLKQHSRRDEIGDITRSFINMRNQITDIINSIKSETENIDTSSQALAEDADNVHSHAREISDTTEQLSAGMEETAASSQEMSATAVEIEKEVDNVASKAINGQTITSEIKNRAETLKEVAIDSRKTATEMYNTANKKLRQSIEKANSIEQIKALSQTIMAITAQTNLLALNASIESARAGEAGKGFAVVANEISQLADNSKKAVSKINEITNDVAAAFMDMIAASNNLLEFVDQKVIKDYDILVQTGEQYNDDANTVETMVSDIRTSASQLSESIKYIINAIEEVTTATADGSSSSAQIAEKSNLIFKKIDQILDQTNSNKKIADKLKTTVQFFEI